MHTSTLFEETWLALVEHGLPEIEKLIAQAIGLLTAGAPVPKQIDRGRRAIAIDKLTQAQALLNGLIKPF